MKALFRIVVTLIIALLFIIPAQAQEPVVHAILFYSQNCPHCYKVITEDLPPLVEKYGNHLVIAGIDTYTEQGNLLYQSAIENFHIPQERLGVPTLIIGETVLVGSLEIPKQLPVLIEAGLTGGGIAWPDWPLFQQLLEAQEEEDSTSNLPPETEQVSPDQVTDTLEATSTVETDHDDQQTPALAKTNVTENASILPNSSKDEQADEEGSDKPEGQHPIMRTYFDCYPCFLRQALSAARRVGASDHQQLIVLQRVLALLKGIQPGQTPPEIGYRVHQIVCETVDSLDPFREAKDRSTIEALRIYPKLKQMVTKSYDPLDLALRISIAGNIIDFGPREHIDDLAAEIYLAIDQPIYLDHWETLRARLNEVDHLLFLADNAGETVFDRILIETLSPLVIYAVKGGPILNDATEEDAVAAGLHEITTLINTGSDAPGTILSFCSSEFNTIFQEAPIIIAKGQANYETLSEVGENVFCLLQVKCPIIARDIGAPVGNLIVCQSTRAINL